MTARIALLMATILLSATAGSALAQDAVGAGLAGEIVRVTPVEGPQVTGTATTLDSGSLAVATRPNRSRSFPLSEIRLLEQRVGGDSDVGQGALWGAGLGLVAGGVGGGALADAICSSQTCNQVGMALGLGAVGAAGGALVGAVFGALSSSTLWEVVPLDGLAGSADAGRGPAGGIAVSLRLRIATGPEA